MKRNIILNEQGGAALIGIVAIALVVVVGSAFVPITRHFNDGRSSNVLGASTDTDVKIVQNGNSSVIVQDITGATSDYNVNQNGGTVTVTTSNGPQTVNVLPNDAVKNTFGAKVMNDVVSNNSSESLGSINQLVALKEENGVLGYQINGVKKDRLLGIPVKTNVTAFVSAQDGQVVQTQESLMGLILNKISF